MHYYHVKAVIFLCFRYLDVLRTLHLWRPKSGYWNEFGRKITWFLIFLVKDIIHFTSIFVQIFFLQENPYLILPYLSIKVIFCVGIGACFVLFLILCLADIVLYGVLPRFNSMDSSEVSVHLLWTLVIFCGAGIVIGKYEFEL